MPLLNGRRLRKRWRWVGAFADNLMVFAAVVQVGPASMTFWGVWDRERRRLWERTRRGLPGRRRDVEMRGRSVHVRAGNIEFDLELAEGNPIECMCPNGEGGYTWTRKAAGMPVRGEVRIGRRTNTLEGLGVEDDSAGYHPRYTSWKWSAGVGMASDGRSFAWNLVSGINDPPTSSERDDLARRGADRARSRSVSGSRLDPLRGRVAAQLHRRDPAIASRGHPAPGSL